MLPASGDPFADHVIATAAIDRALALDEERTARRRDELVLDIRNAAVELWNAIHGNTTDTETDE